VTPDNGQHEEQGHLQYLADAMPQLVWTADGDGQVDYYNSRAAEYGGIEQTAPGTWDWRPVVHPDDLTSTLDAWSSAVATGVPYQCEHRVRMADGSYRWHLSRGVPLVAQGRVVKWFGTATDIHSLKLAEQELRDAARHKDEFLAMLAHELRNPLAPIRNVVEWMRGQPLEAPMQRMHGILDRQVTQMARLIEDLLEISRISRGHIRLERRRVQLGPILDLATETITPMLHGSGHRIDRRTAADDVWLDADAVRLSQAFANLLSNAVKFTPAAGEIILESTISVSEVRVRVRDNGIGLDAPMLDRVFEMFTQVHPDSEHGAGGLGIGLALVRRIAVLHGGDVFAASEGLGTGSTFEMVLPRAAEAAASND
jgi:PAS domain S-box-containing protein